MEQSGTLRAMSTVPVYLWAVCGIFRQSREIPKTVTELLLYNLLLFLQNHWLYKTKPSITLNDLVNDDNVYKCIKDVALFAYETLRQRKLVIQLQSESDNLNKLKDTGIIDKYLDGITGLTLIEFRHLTIQELLAAMYIMLQTDIEKKQIMLEDDALASTLGFVSGLEGLLLCSNKTVLNLFVKKLFNDIGDEMKTTFIDSMFNHSSSEMFFKNKTQEYLYEFQTTTAVILSHLQQQNFSNYSYGPATNLHCKDHLINLLNQNKIKVTVERFTLFSKSIQYGNEGFIIQLLRDHSEHIKHLDIQLNNKYFHQISTVITEMVNLSWINLFAIMVNVQPGYKYGNTVLSKISQFAPYAKYIDFQGGVWRLDLLLKVNFLLVSNNYNELLFFKKKN